MRLSTKGRYAVTAMIDIAHHSRGNPIPLAEIASRQAISLSYLEQLFARLRRAGLVKSVRGPGGGYLLPRDMNDIKIADIVHAVEAANGHAHPAGSDRHAGAQPLWEELDGLISGFLASVSIGDVCAGRIGGVNGATAGVRELRAVAE